jgi:multicomponent Na+:H+ antiporter subunit D
LGVLGLVLGQGKILALFALAGGIASLTVWAPGFPESLVGSLPFGVAVAGDPWALGIWGLALTLHLAVLVQGWLKDGLYHSLITVLVGTCLAGGISRDLFNLYVVLELSSLLSVVLVAKEGRSAAVWAALRYLLLAGVGMTLYLFGLGLVYGRTGVLAITSLSQTDFSEPSLRVGVGLLLSGAAVKAGVFLLGLWLPPAHGQAPTEISALLSGVVVKLGIVTLARIAEAFPIEPVLLSLGILTGFGGLVYALWERDLKILLGHHTVSQLGYMLIGLGLGAWEAALFYTVAHGLFKALLFLSAGMAVEAKGARTLAELKGGLPRPVVLGLALGTWAIVGLPPLVGFAGKNALSFASPTWAKALLQGLSLGTAVSFAKLFPLCKPEKGGSLGGIPFLAAGVVALGILGFFLFPGLLHPISWLEAFSLAFGGYGVHLFLGPRMRTLPRITFDWAVLWALISAFGLAFGLLLGTCWI